MLIRTDRFREFDRLTERMMGTATRPATMPMDAFREGDRFVIEMDLPGVSPDSIDLDVERNVLTVHADRHSSAPRGVEMTIAERTSGRFSRQLFLSESLDPDAIEASYQAGVLRLEIPIAAHPAAHKIAVTGSESRERIARH